MIAYALLSFSPPTNADALSYHWGIPVYLLRHQEWPSTNLWYTASLGGIGEVFNTLGVALYAENLGTILQSLSLIVFSFYLANKYDGSKRKFLYLYILSSPVLILLVSTPKPQLFPEILTTLALYLTVSEKNIDKRIFLLICCLLMGAMQQKLSFLLTGGFIGLWAFLKAFRSTKSVLVIGIMCFVFFFLPRGIWNLEQAPNLGFNGFFSPIPSDLLDSMHRNSLEGFPLKLFIPESFGMVTTILGFQIIFLFLVRTKNKKYWEVMVICTIGILASIFLGQTSARTFYEFILWTAVAFSFLPKEEFRFKLCNNFLLLQGVGVLIGAAFGVFTLLPGVFSEKWRLEVMHRYAWEYSTIAWVNQVLPENSVVLSDPRSVALYSHDFIPRDCIINCKSVMKNKFFEALKLLKPNFVVVRNENHVGNLVFDLAGCFEGIYSGPKFFARATRNPFNKGLIDKFSIYHFNSSLLPGCLKDNY